MNLRSDIRNRCDHPGTCRACHESFRGGSKVSYGSIGVSDSSFGGTPKSLSGVIPLWTTLVPYPTGTLGSDHLD